METEYRRPGMICYRHSFVANLQLLAIPVDFAQTSKVFNIIAQQTHVPEDNN